MKKAKIKHSCFGEGYKLTVAILDQGDMSVGIEPTQVEITIKANVEFKSNINYKDNREQFRKQIAELACWFTDMPVQVVLEDVCIDCGQITDGQVIHECPIHALER